MSTILRLTVLTGPHKKMKYCMCPSGPCLVGRADDCPVRLHGTDRDQLISRHHCQLDFRPPSLEIEDLGSQNGTFLNGTFVESVTLDLESLADPRNGGGRIVLNQGDLLTVGGTTFQVDVMECSTWQAGERVKTGCPVEC
jgi:pSer/pThr/pTyr-binding forkhead associated (FHA) protein